MTMAQLSYKVINERSIFVFPDTTAKHLLYDEQVIRTFYISNADPTELSQTLSQLIRIAGIAVQPMIAPNKTSNTITVRATVPFMQILERIIEQNDKPRAEIIVDVSILEVDRNRTKSYGLNLSDYAIGADLLASRGTGRRRRAAGTDPATRRDVDDAPALRHRRASVQSPPPFNLNTISRGVSTADFYLAVPTAIVRFLETDTRRPKLSRSRSCAGRRAASSR